MDGFGLVLDIGCGDSVWFRSGLGGVEGIVADVLAVWRAAVFKIFGKIFGAALARERLAGESGSSQPAGMVYSGAAGMMMFASVAREAAAAATGSSLPLRYLERDSPGSTMGSDGLASSSGDSL